METEELTGGELCETNKEPKPYPAGENLTCYECPSGFFLRENCTQNNTIAVCHKCPDGYFSILSGIHTQCERCTPHCLTPDLVVVRNCSSTNDLVCGCRPGFGLRIPNDQRHGCKRLPPEEERSEIVTQESSSCVTPKLKKYWKILNNPSNRTCYECPSGFFLKENCTKNNTIAVCHKCPDGHFSILPGIHTQCERCTPHCLTPDLEVVRNCSSTNDLKCGCPPGFGLRIPNDQRHGCKRHPPEEERSEIVTQDIDDNEEERNSSRRSGPPILPALDYNEERISSRRYELLALPVTAAVGRNSSRRYRNKARPGFPNFPNQIRYRNNDIDDNGEERNSSRRYGPLILPVTAAVGLNSSWRYRNKARPGFPNFPNQIRNRTRNKGFTFVGRISNNSFNSVGRISNNSFNSVGRISNNNYVVNTDYPSLGNGNDASAAVFVSLCVPTLFLFVALYHIGKKVIAYIRMKKRKKRYKRTISHGDRPPAGYPLLVSTSNRHRADAKPHVRTADPERGIRHMETTRL